MRVDPEVKQALQTIMQAAAVANEQNEQPPIVLRGLGSTTRRHTMDGWMAAFDARLAWLSTLVVHGCVVCERGQLQRTAAMGIRCVGLDLFNLSCCAGCSERRSAIPGRATVLPSRSVRVLIV